MLDGRCFRPSFDIEHMFDYSVVPARRCHSTPVDDCPEETGVFEVQSRESRVESLEVVSTRDSRLATRDSLPSLLPGQVASLVGPPGYGLTRIGLTMLAEHSGPVAYVDVRGWFNPLAAWEVGIEPDRLHVVRCDDILRWSRAAAALLEGVEAVFAEVPGGVKDAAIRKLGALARTRRAVLYLRPLRGSLPSGVAQLSLESQAVSWDGADRGHGSIAVRRSVVTASGKTMRGTTRTIEMEDDGTDAVRVVSRVGASQPGVAVG